MLDIENWEDDFDTLLHLVKEFIVAIWEVRKQKTHTQVNFSASPRPGIGVLLLELGVDLGKSGISHGKGEGHVVHAGVNCVCNVCGSAHSCGCVVNVRQPFEYYYYYYCAKQWVFRGLPGKVLD